MITLMGKTPPLFKGEVRVSCEPTGSPLPSAQNNPHAKVARVGEAGLSLISILVAFSVFLGRSDSTFGPC